MSVIYRPAAAGDAEAIADLHADSWRRFYRGAYADSFLDGDVLTDRRGVWTDRLASRDPLSITLVAEVDDAVAGFVRVALDWDPRWGSLLDNLHVRHDTQRLGVGSGLIVRAARGAAERGMTTALHLFVLEQNTAAQAFYAAHGGSPVERVAVSPPNGVPGRLNGQPYSLCYAWPDARALAPVRPAEPSHGR